MHIVERAVRMRRTCSKIAWQEEATHTENGGEKSEPLHDPDA
jgi:hypothetical protein